MTITIKNYGLEAKVTINDDCTITETFDAIIGLLNVVGYNMHLVNQTIIDKAENIIENDPNIQPK